MPYRRRRTPTSSPSSPVAWEKIWPEATPITIVGRALEELDKFTHASNADSMGAFSTSTTSGNNHGLAPPRESSQPQPDFDTDITPSLSIKAVPPPASQRVTQPADDAMKEWYVEQGDVEDSCQTAGGAAAAPSGTAAARQWGGAKRIEVNGRRAAQDAEPALHHSSYAKNRARLLPLLTHTLWRRTRSGPVHRRQCPGPESILDR